MPPRKYENAEMEEYADLFEELDILDKSPDTVFPDAWEFSTDESDFQNYLKTWEE